MMADAQVRLDPPAPARGERARFRTLLVFSVLLLAASVTVVVGLVSPGFEAEAAGREADGVRAFEFSGSSDGAAAPADAIDAPAVVTVTPEAGWWVEPDAEALRLGSPDRTLGIEMRVVTEREAREALEGVTAGGDPLLTETLASGTRVQHVTAGEEFIAAAELGDAVVLVVAAAAPEVELADYRVALGHLLNSMA
jgi:hypothetical protein